MPIDFRKPQYFKEFRFGNNLIWNTIKKSLNTFTGEIVRFFSEESEPIVKLEANFTPIQNLNGQEAPWPPGGGKNKLPPAASTSAVTINGVTITPYADGHYHISKGAATESAALIRFDLASAVSVSSGMYYAPICSTTNANIIVDIVDNNLSRIATGYCGKTSTEITDAGSGTGTKISFYVTGSQHDLNIDIYPLVSTTATNTFAPYANICPISGHTGCEVVRTGKNLLPNKKVIRGSAREILIGQSSTTDYIFLKAGQYAISWGLVGGGGSAYYLPLGGSETRIGSNGASLTLTEDTYLRIWIYIQASQTIDDLTWWQLELGSTATDYEPYSGTTYPILLGTTVYGGTLDVLTGVLTVDRKMFVVDGTNIYVSSNSGYHNIEPRGTYLDRGVGIDSKWLCNMGVCSSVFAVNTTYGFIYLRSQFWDSIATSDAEANAYFAENPMQVVCALATPITIPLTASQINTLVGNNVVWVNDATGDITVQAYGTAIT